MIPEWAQADQLGLSFAQGFEGSAPRRQRSVLGGHKRVPKARG
jgi:hypothetical protein